MFAVRSTNEEDDETRVNMQYTDDTPQECREDASQSTESGREGVPQGTEYREGVAYTQVERMDTAYTLPERVNMTYTPTERVNTTYTQAEGVNTTYTQAERVNTTYTPAEAVSTMYSQAEDGNIMYTPMERVEPGTHATDPEFKSRARTSMRSDTLERSYVSLLADIATIGQPDCDAARSAVVLQTEPTTHTAPYPAGLAYTDQQIVGVPQNSDSLQYGDISLRHASQMSNSLNQYPNIAYMTEQGTMQVEPGTGSGGDTGNIIIIQPVMTQGGNQNQVNIQEITTADGNKTENIVNEELQDAVANISNSRTMVMVTVREGGITTAKTEIERDGNVTMATGANSEVVLNMPMKSYKTVRRTPRKKLQKVSERTILPSTPSPRLQKFTADDLTGMGTTEKEILVNILEQSKKKSGRKRKYDNIETGVAKVRVFPVNSVDNIHIEAGASLADSVDNIETGVAEASVCQADSVHNIEANATLTDTVHNIETNATLADTVDNMETGLAEVNDTPTDSVGTDQVTDNMTNVIVTSAGVTIDHNEDSPMNTLVDDAMESDLADQLPNVDHSNIVGSDKSRIDKLIIDLPEVIEGSVADSCTGTESSEQGAAQADSSIGCSDSNKKTDLKLGPESTPRLHKVAKFEEIQTRSKRRVQDKLPVKYKKVDGKSRRNKQIKLENPAPDTEREVHLPTSRRSNAQQTSKVANLDLSVSEIQDTSEGLAESSQPLSKRLCKPRKTKPIGSKSRFHVMIGATHKKSGRKFTQSSDSDESHSIGPKKKNAASKHVTVESTESINSEQCDDADGRGEADDNVEGRFSELYRLFHYDDKSVVRLAPVLVDIVRDNDFVVEVDIADGLEVGQLEKRSVSGGLTRYSFCVSRCKDRNLQTGEQSRDAKRSRHSVESESGDVDDRDLGVMPSENSKVMPGKTDDKKIKNKSSNKSIKGRKSKVKKQLKVVKSETLNSDTNVKNDAEKDDEDDRHVEEVLLQCDGTEVSDADNDPETLHNSDLVINDVKLEIEYPNDVNRSNIVEADISAAEITECTSDPINSDADHIEMKVEKEVLRQYKSKKKAKKAVNHKNYITRINEAGEKEYACPLCAYVSKYSQNANIHVQEHSGEKNIMCEECGTCWKSKARLHRHMVVHQRSRPFSCPLCKLTFKSKNVYSCTECPHETCTRQNMVVHAVQHTDARPYQCEVCGQTFKGPSNLSTHRRQHSTERNYRCTMCGSSFRDRGTYTQHMRRHLGDKRHVCEHCGKSFVISSDLKKHLRTHTGEKPYRCVTCGKSFSDGSGLTRHRNMHAPRFRYECGVCDKQFTRTDLCSYHVKKLHPDAGPVVVRKINVEEELSSNSSSSSNIRGTTGGQQAVGYNVSASNEGTTSVSGRYGKQSSRNKTWVDFEILTAEASRRVKHDAGGNSVSDHEPMVTHNVFQFPVAAGGLASSSSDREYVEMPIYSNKP